MEQRIKIEFPEYPFYEEDFQLASTIKGFQQLGYVNPKPFGPWFYYKVNNETTEESINIFLDTLPKEFGFSFSESGTTLKVQRVGNKYFFYPFAHGKSSIWHSVTRSEMLKLIYDNKAHQYQQSFRTFRATLIPVEGENAYKK